jgi:tRNA pseudouridine55 synthase
LNKIKKFLHGAKLGHCGTLDPFASGLLIIAVNEATKLIDYCMNLDKEYEFTIGWGTATDTDDLTGHVIASSDKIPTAMEIHNILRSFTGDIIQKTPIYSALHINGTRAYDLARNNIPFIPPSRQINIKQLKMIDDRFVVQCSKGCYVRSIGRDMAEKLDTYGHVTSLKRTKIADFSLENAFTLDEIQKFIIDNQFEKFILPINHILNQNIKQIYLKENEIKKIKNGQKLEYNIENYDHIVILDEYHTIIALAKSHDNFLYVKRVLNIRSAV